MPGLLRLRFELLLCSIPSTFSLFFLYIFLLGIAPAACWFKIEVAPKLQNKREKAAEFSMFYTKEDPGLRTTEYGIRTTESGHGTRDLELLATGRMVRRFAGYKQIDKQTDGEANRRTASRIDGQTDSAASAKFGAATYIRLAVGDLLVKCKCNECTI